MIDKGENESGGEELRTARVPNSGRRGFLKISGLAGLGTAAAGAAFPLVARAQSAAAGNASVDWIPNVQPGGKKVRIGVPLGYGPYNQPWRRGCWRLVQKIVELGGEPVTMRGQPSKSSEQTMERALLDRNVDALVMGIYTSEEQSAYIAKEAHKRGIPTVGFAVNVIDSPASLADVWGTALKLSYYMFDAIQRQGTIVQTAESQGFYQPFDEQVAMLDLMTKFEPSVKMLPRLQGAVSTQDEISISRTQVMALLEAHPKKGSIDALISWWWPMTVGAAQALKRMKRTEIKLFNHYFSDQFLQGWVSGDYEIAASTDAPWTIMGEKAGEIAVAMARGMKVPPRTYHAPVRFINTVEEAKQWLTKLKSWDEQSVAYLKKYGG